MLCCTPILPTWVSFNGDHLDPKCISFANIAFNMPKAMLYQILDAAVHSANVLCLMRRKYHDYFFIIEVKNESTRGVKINIKAIKRNHWCIRIFYSVCTYLVKTYVPNSWNTRWISLNLPLEKFICIAWKNFMSHINFECRNFIFVNFFYNLFIVLREDV